MPAVFKKDTFKLVAREPFPNGQPVVFPVEIPVDKINGVHVQKTADLYDFPLGDPDTTRFAATAVAWTIPAGSGIKPEIKSIPSNNAHSPAPSF